MTNRTRSYIKFEGKHIALSLALLFLTQSCAQIQDQNPAFKANRGDESVSSILDHKANDQEEQLASVSEVSVASDPQTIIGPTPILDKKIRESINEAENDSLEMDLKGEPIQVNYNNLPIASFINEVFGEQLNLSYTIDPELADQADLVTLRINGLTELDELFRIARSTLRTYGVVIEQGEDLLTFAIDPSGSGGEIPLLLSGRALPDVPDSMRPIFMFVPLQVVSNNRVKQWLSTALKGQQIDVSSDPVRNAIVLNGRPAAVEQALSIIGFLDQPLIRSKYSLNIEPAFMTASDLSTNLEKILTAEGYEVSTNPRNGNIVLLPLAGAGSLIVFAPTEDALKHIREWAQNIDRRQQLAIDKGIFSYEAANVRSEHIVNMLNQLDVSPDQDERAGGNSNNNSVIRPIGSRGRFVVDENRNAIVFKGSGQEWMEMLPVIKDMDKPAPSVLVEILIAEVTLNDQETSGVEWLSNSSVNIGDKTFRTNYGTFGDLGLGGNGFGLTLDSAGGTRAALNAFYENRRAEIRSRPRLMVKSGQTATIDVGSEIPIITSESTSNQDADAPTVRSVQYRQTGLSLTISPIVHSSGYVDIEISQDLSESSQTLTSSINSPTIFNRHIDTTVTLKDGGSVLLGGLVSSSGSAEQDGIPGLGKVPLLGRLFRADSESQDRTELMILVMPYVLASPLEADALSKILAPEYNLQ